jgi:hypothetical protein
MARATPLKGITPSLRLDEAARLVIGPRTADLARWAAYAGDRDAVAELHNMRIAAKRLRYSLELLQTVLPAGTTALLDAVQQLQERLGTIHDHDVLLEILRRQVATSAVVAATAHAEAIIHAQGTPTESEALPANVRGLYDLLALVAAHRVEAYGAFREWWDTQVAEDNNLLRRLAELAAVPAS